MAAQAAAKTAVIETVEEETTVDEAVAAPVEQTTPAVVEAVTAQPTTKSVRVKGTWTMYWGTEVWDFVDGQRYDLPVDLFNYLRNAGNIYDTL